MTDITLTPAQFATLLDLLGTADTGEQEYQLTMNLTAKLLLLRMGGGGSPVTPPVASFTSSITNLSVAFTDTSTESPTSWLWDFGDGNTSTSQNPTHVYAGQGTYNVTLQATNAGGSDTTAATPIAVNTAFHAALITAAFVRAFDFQQTSGTSEPNIGTQAGVTTVITGATLGQTDSTGTNDAYLMGSGDSIISTTSTSFGNLTFLLLMKPLGTLTGSDIFLTLGSGLNLFTLKAVSGGSAIEWVYTNSAGSRSLTMTTNTGVLVSGQLTAIICRYNTNTGVGQLQYSDDGTIKTPTYAVNNSPQIAITGGTLLTPSLYTGSISTGGTVVSALAYMTHTGGGAVPKTDAQILAILSTIPSWV